MGFAVTTYGGAVGLLSARVSSMESHFRDDKTQITLGINSDRYAEFEAPCEVIDGKMLGVTTTVNAKKQQIASLGPLSVWQSAPVSYASTTDALNAVTNLYPQTVTSSGFSTYTAINDSGQTIILSRPSSPGFSTYLTFAAAQTWVAGEYVVQSSGTYGKIVSAGTSTGVILEGVPPFKVFTAGGACSVGVGTTYSSTPGDSVGTISSVSYVGYGSIFEDLTISTFYPNLEPANTSVDSPYVVRNLTKVQSSNVGVGVANTFYSNADDPANNSRLVWSSATFYGRVYAFSTTTNAGAATSITNIEAEVATERVGLVSFATAGDSIKKIKKGFAVHIWSYKKDNVITEASITSLKSAIEVLNDPANGGPY